MKCVIVSQGVATPQLPVYVCRSGKLSPGNSNTSYCTERERPRETEGKKKWIKTGEVDIRSWQGSQSKQDNCKTNAKGKILDCLLLHQIVQLLSSQNEQEYSSKAYSF